MPCFVSMRARNRSQTRVIHHAVVQERGGPHTGSIGSGISRACGTGRVGFLTVEKFTLPETNVTPESLRLEDWGKAGLFFRCELLVSGRIDFDFCDLYISLFMIIDLRDP